MAKREMRSKEESVVIDTSSLKPNSKVSKAKAVVKEEKTVEKVVKGQVKRYKHKKTLSERFRDTFLSEDTSDVKSYLVFQILIPALRDTVSELIKSGTDMIIYGDSRPKNVNRGRNGGSYVSYGSYYGGQSRPQTPPRREGRYNRRANHDFRDVVFPDRQDAEEVLSGLVDLTMQYEVASIDDFNSLAGLEGNFTDRDFGWEDLDDAQVVRVQGGWALDLPRPYSIKE